MSTDDSRAGSIRLSLGCDLPATTTSVAQTLSSPDVVTRTEHVWLTRSRLLMPFVGSGRPALCPGPAATGAACLLWTLDAPNPASRLRYSGIARNHVKPALGRLALDKVDAPRIQRLYAEMHDDCYKPSDDLNGSCRHSPVAGSRAEDALDRSQRRHDVQGPPQRDRDARAIVPSIRSSYAF